MASTVLEAQQQAFNKRVSNSSIELNKNAASHAAYLAAEEERKRIQALENQKPKLPPASQQVTLGVLGKIAKAGRAARTAISGVNTTNYTNSDPTGINNIIAEAAAAEAEKAAAEKASAEAEKASAETKDTVFFTLDKITYACHIRKGNNREEGEILVEKGESYLVRIIESPA